MRRILVLRGGALGDFIVTLPTLELLRHRWPLAQIELVGNATAAQLAVARGIVDAAHSQQDSRWSSLFAPPGTTLAADFAAWLATFDLVISYWPDPDCDLARRFPIGDHQMFLSAPALPTLAPAAAHYGAILRPLGLTLDKHFTPIAPLPGIVNQAQSQRPITIHPGSGSLRKNWPLECWRELIGQLPGPVQVILGEAEIERSTLADCVWPGTQLQLNPPLEELVQALAASRLFLGHDSGVSHLAAACGVPCVLLFGPTDPAMWAPPIPSVRVVKNGTDLTNVSVAEMLRVTKAALAARA